MPMRLDALLMVLVLEGASEIALDYVPYTIGANSFTIIMPTHTIQLNKISEDFKGKLLVISREFIDECNTAKRSPSMANYMQLRKNPCTTFEPQETELVDNYIELLRSKIKKPDAFLSERGNAECVCRVSVGNSQYFHGKEGWFADACPFPKGRNCSSNSFNCCLNIAKSNMWSHSMRKKLFITPQYLSLILKELTGKSANKWIDDALIVEAKKSC